MTTLPISTSGITGTDGIQPVYNPYGTWKTWALSEIFTGQAGQDRYVPRVKDLVYDTDTDITYKVTAIDPVTLISTLVVVRGVPVEEFGDNDKLLGVGPGTQSDTYRLYIDKSVVPYTLAVDARLHVAGSTVTKCMIFKGSVVNSDQVVISEFYDQSGQNLGPAVPLELVVGIVGQNLAVKTVPVCYTSYDLQDAEVVTAVFYSDNGNVVSKRQLLVENTGFIRTPSVGVKYVQSIALETPFLSNHNTSEIIYPINVPLSGLSLIGVINYTDGTKTRLPVDGTRFTIFGFNNYAATIVGQTMPIVLKYMLAQNEIAYGNNVVVNGAMTRNFTATTAEEDGSYSPKLFGYPVWVDMNTGYRMVWYMETLDRSSVYNVTPYVRMAYDQIPFDSTHMHYVNRAFDPTAYGVLQHLVVSLDLHDVNGSFKHYNYIQTMDLVLAGPGTDRVRTNWTIAYTPGQVPPYGVDTYAISNMINQNLWTIDLSSGATSLNDWLDKVYWKTQPLYDTQRETNAPVPDYFSLDFGGQLLTFPVSQWNLTQTIINAVPDSSTVFIRFFKRTNTSDLQLGVSAMIVYELPNGPVV